VKVLNRPSRYVTLGALVVSSSCYAYLPTMPNVRPLPGSEVQLGLTDSATVVLASSVGPSVGTITGRLAADSGDMYVLSVTKTERRDGIESDWRGERLAISRALVTSVATRRFSPGRTILFSALTSGALVAIAEAFAGGGGATTPGGTPTGPPAGK